MPDAAALSPTLEEVHAEGVRLAEAARAQGLPLKLMGGVAIWVRCPSARTGQLARLPADVDFASRSKRRQDIVRFFEGEGYVPDKLFNALHGASRLNFADPALGRQVDVILDRFAMCHTIELRDSLGGPELAVSVTDLLALATHG